MKIGLIDVDYKVRCLALMRLSTYWKERGAEVYLNQVEGMDKVFVSVLFRHNRLKAIRYLDMHPDVTIGGYGYDLHSQLPPEIEACSPDYRLYTVEDVYKRTCGGIGTKEKKIARATEFQRSGMGFSSYGCVRSCPWCIVPKTQGKFRQGEEIGKLINPESDLLMLLDNNFTADPLAIAKLAEMKERNIRIEISQGFDIRLLYDELAHAISTVRHRDSIHYAWDRVADEQQILQGISMLTKYVRPYRQMAFVLCGFDSGYQEAVYRTEKLIELGVAPYIMVYQDPEADHEGPSKAITEFEWFKIKHYARYINGRVYKVCHDFSDYKNWIKYQEEVA